MYLLHTNNNNLMMMMVILKLKMIAARTPAADIQYTK